MNETSQMDEDITQARIEHLLRQQCLCQPVQDRLWLKAMLFWLNSVLPQVALWGKGILCLRRFCYARNMYNKMNFYRFTSKIPRNPIGCGFEVKSVFSYNTYSSHPQKERNQGA